MLSMTERPNGRSKGSGRKLSALQSRTSKRSESLDTLVRIRTGITQRSSSALIRRQTSNATLSNVVVSQIRRFGFSGLRASRRFLPSVTG
jgi:hypothetical protein